MTDNTTLPVASGGDVIRDIDRAGTKTQVIQLDAGGQISESLVSGQNPLPVVDPNIIAAQTTDAPLSVSIAGDPNGDFAGVNILEQVVTDGSGFALNAKIINPPGKFDAQGALVASDAPAPIILNGAVGQNIIIDTTGYQSLAVTTQAMAANLTASNDGILFSVLNGTTINTAPNGMVNQVAASSNYIFPCPGRYIRFAVLTAGSATCYLRAVPWNGYFTSAPTNITQIGGNTAAGLAGVMPVGGPSASGSATIGVNPVVMGGGDQTVGSSKIRPLLTESSGRLQVTPALDGQGNTGRQQGVLNTSFQQVPTTFVQHSEQNEGRSIDELLAAMLLELQIHNQLMAELPRKIYEALQTLQQPPISQANFAGLSTSDEPAAFRNDPTIFIN